MNARWSRTNVLAILLAVGLGACLAFALTYSGQSSSFAVVVESGHLAVSPLAVVISRLLFAAITVATLGLLGWLCLRSLKRGRNRDDS